MENNTLEKLYSFCYESIFAALLNEKKKKSRYYYGFHFQFSYKKHKDCIQTVIQLTSFKEYCGYNNETEMFLLKNAGLHGYAWIPMLLTQRKNSW
jgi:hypothetical protein